jgi:hypothetical protein
MPKESIPHPGTNGHPVVEHMQRCGIPVTRENFIDMNWPDGKPDPWEADHEADVPDELQDWSQFEIEDQTMKTMREFGFKGSISRQDYLDFIRASDDLQEPSAEMESMLPEHLQDWSQFEKKGHGRR